VQGIDASIALIKSKLVMGLQEAYRSRFGAVISSEVTSFKQRETLTSYNYKLKRIWIVNLVLLSITTQQG
jgi:hypothetical protein